MRYEVLPLPLKNGIALGIHLELPDTHLIIATTERGYITCGLLDVTVMDAVHPERGVVAGRAFGVLSLDDLLEARLRDVTATARLLGISEGMIGREALELLLLPADEAQAQEL
ncbi:MAG: DUF1805 domain-containing protein [Ardenticatenaceae bacterium]|nr:DUF1805 domain-containing protein [Ardenticatenaceae bacterium]